MADVTMTKDQYLSLLEEGIDKYTGEDQQECIEALLDFAKILDEVQDDE
jgi:hypothetical protein